MQIIKNKNLRSYNTFGVEVSAEHFVEIIDEAGLKALIASEGYKKQPVRMVLGSGSNILFKDDYRGLIIKNSILGVKVLSQKDGEVFVEAGGGENWHALVMFAVKNGWSGIENLSLIPGTVGAAPVQNIGAYGSELKDVFESLDAVSLKDGHSRSFNREDCGFGYRESVFKNSLKGEYMIVRVVIRLKTGGKPDVSYAALTDYLKEKNIQNPSVSEVSEAVIAIRNSKLPDPAVIGNCGSFFKNPIVAEAVFSSLKLSYPEMPFFPAGDDFFKIPAGWLIEKCGWKGKSVGNVGVHEKQALVIVNKGGAKGPEAFKLSVKIAQDVFEKFGVDIVPEVNIV